MSFIFEIVSGNIAEGVEYQVVGSGTSVIYNSITYPVGSYFTGVSGQTTYTKTDGTEIVTEASVFKGLGIGEESGFFLGKFTDESIFKGLGVGEGDPLPYYVSYTVTERKQNDTPNGFNEWGYKISINPLNDQFIAELTGKTATSPPLSYSELLTLISDNQNVQADIDADGIITNFKIARFN